jgi:hypothetical protein
MLPAKFGSIWPISFRGDFFNISQSETRIAFSLVAIFVGGKERNEETL